MKKVRSIISSVLWTLILVILAAMVAFNLGPVQRWIGSGVASALGTKLGTEVSVGRVDIGLPARLVVDDVVVLDQQRARMLEARRMAASIDVAELLRGRVSLSSVQLFGMKANLYRHSDMAQANYQFVIDSLSSGSKGGHTPLNLAIQTVIIRHGAVSLDFPGLRLGLSDISSHAMLYALTDDSLSMNLRRLSLTEQSGFQLSGLSFRLKAGRQTARLENLRLQLPATDIRVPLVEARYRRRGKGIDPASLLYSGSIEGRRLTIADVASLVPQLRHFHNALSFSIVFNGSADKLQANNIIIASTDNTLSLSAFGKASLCGRHSWHAHLNRFHLSPDGISFIARNLRGRSVDVPPVVERLGTIDYTGDIDGDRSRINIDGRLSTSAGRATMSATVAGRSVSGHVSTTDLDLGRLAATDQLGRLTADLSLRADLKSKTAAARGRVASLFYGGYRYHDITLDAAYARGSLSGRVASADPNLRLTLSGSARTDGRLLAVDATVGNISPHAIGLTTGQADRSYGFTARARLRGRNIDDVLGSLDIDDFRMTSAAGDYGIGHVGLEAEPTHGGRLITIDSDVAQARIEGRWRMATLVNTLANIVGSRVPTMPGLPQHRTRGNNSFTIDATLLSSEWLQRIFGVPLQADRPVSLSGMVDEPRNAVDLHLLAPRASYGSTQIENGRLDLETVGDSLMTRASLDRLSGDHRQSLSLSAAAADNHLLTTLGFSSGGRSSLRGTLNADTRFYSDANHRSMALIGIRRSDVYVGDTLWNVEPGTISYNGREVAVDNFKVGHGRQHLTVSGVASPSSADSLVVDLQDMSVDYIMDLVNFHAVDFDGMATGRAVVRGVMGRPAVAGKVRVDDFLFEGGRLGTLNMLIGYDSSVGQLTFDAMAREDADHYMPIKGYVDLKHNSIDLGLRLHQINADFVGNYCSAFADRVACRGSGWLRVYGDLSRVFLVGQVEATGSLRVTPLGTAYSLNRAVVDFRPDTIAFRGDTLTDAAGHHGVLSGQLTHRSFTRFAYDLDISAHDLLCYDRDYDGNSFRGHVVMDGRCAIRGRSGATMVEVEGTPGRGSTIEYNTATTQVDESEFIHWGTPQMGDSVARTAAMPDIPSDLRLNLIINSTPDLTLRVITDPATGDYIALQGSGVVRASYFNKGSFEMFGNYDISHGIYKLTIQNLIKREFQFQEGSRIVFGGDPFQAQLNLQGLYTLNSVSLNDLQIGRSLSANNVRVNCLMNITGTPAEPRLSFDMDIPTLSADARQMVKSVINSEEDMNQQVLYLLAVGRFQAPSANNAQLQASQQSQTSLAMQSVLSGTLSQQINNVLSSFVKSDNWNFGANISTGDEGFNNAEYEGLLNGRLLNNRLLINGQFGYRDKATTGNTSFIGDFDIRYLIFPNGNLAVKVYNQTNDRYFTRNSLNTQGIGLILKKDFSSWRDLIGLKRRKTAKK